MRYKRLMFAGAIAVAACGYAMLSIAQPPKGAACGLGPPPGSPMFAKFEARRAEEVARTGYLTVCESNLSRFNVSSQLRPLDEATAALEFHPVELAGTPFSSFANIGALAEAVSNKQSRLYRSFRMPDGHTVTLFEHDMSADGTHSYRRPKDEPERINDLPARLVVLQAGQDKAVSVLSWNEGRRYYEIWLDANVVLEQKRAQLFALATSLPKSIPARLDEPPADPVRLGPDGVPFMPPPPATIQMDTQEHK
jgi:hypothetical protein